MSRLGFLNSSARWPIISQPRKAKKSRDITWAAAPTPRGAKGTKFSARTLPSDEITTKEQYREYRADDAELRPSRYLYAVKVERDRRQHESARRDMRRARAPAE